MGVENKSISMLDIAKGKATQIIESSNINDQFQLLTNDFSYNENRFLNKNEALAQLSTIQLSAKSKVAATVLEKQKQLLLTEPGMQKQLVYISDFQKSSFPENLSITDSIKKYFVSVEPTQISNISLDTIYATTPSLMLNEPNTLMAQIKNNGTEDATTSLTLVVNNQLKSIVNTTLKAGETKKEPISYTTATAGYQQMQVYINDYPVSFDDTFYLAGKVNSNFSVLVLNQRNANAFLNSVFKPGIQFKVDNNNVESFNINQLKNYSLVVLNGSNTLSQTLINALSTYIENGGSLLVFPPQSGDMNSLNALLAKTTSSTFAKLDTAKAYITNYNKSHEVFRDLFEKTPENIDLPIVFKHYLLNSSALSSQQKLFSFSNGDAFLNAVKFGNGKIYICASAAETSWSTFPKSYWFLPILYKMAYSNNANAINALTLGKNSSLFINNQQVNDKTIYHLTDKTTDAIPEQRVVGNKVMINVNNATQHAGIFGISLPSSSDTVFTGINYNRNESELSFWDLATLKKSTSIKNADWLTDKMDVKAGINELQHGMPLWKLCIILALLFLLTEILLIKFMK
jgi:hypothetical protein